MRKLWRVALLLVLTIAIFPACKKVVEKIFKGTTATAPDVVMNLPAIPFAIPTEMSMGTTTAYINLDSIVKANTAGVFDASYVNSIKIKEVKITIPEADAMNNLSNFNTGRVTISSNSNNKEIQLLSFNFPQDASATMTITPTNSPELITYLQGNELYYTMYGSMRKPTLKPLSFVVSVTIAVL